MAAFALLDVDLFADELDLSCFTRDITVNVEAAEVDATTFCSGGWMVPISGLRSAMWTAAGPADMATATAAQTSAVDEVLAVDLGSNYVLSAVPAGATAGEVAYFGQGVMMSRTVLDGAVGDLATHSVSFAGSRIIRGIVEHSATLTATGDSTGTQLGAVSASQRIWAAVHFLTAGGTSTPTITVKIQSDDNGSFTTPTDRITFTAQTAKGAQFGSTLGAIADDYWRATWTVSGTTPSFQTRILIGIA